MEAVDQETRLPPQGTAASRLPLAGVGMDEAFVVSISS